MNTPENKMQTPHKQTATCLKCGGSGQTKKADGSQQKCYDCRGSGVASKGYQTK